MAVKLNKDGNPRKKGSGKTRGAGCYAKIPWSDLKKFIGPEVSIPVSRVWLRNLNADLDKYVDQSPNPLPKPSVDESLPSTDTTDTLPESTPETPLELEEIAPFSEPESLESDDSSDFAETEISSASEPETEETEEAPEEKDDSQPEAKDDSQPEAKDEGIEISTGNSLAGIAYRYSQNFDL
jgi:hypothetical protein